MTHPRTPLDTIERYFAALTTRDRDAWLDCFAREGGMEDPAGTPPKLGQAGLGAFFDEVAGALAGMEFRPLAIQLCGDTSAVSWRARLSARNGRRVDCEGIDVFQFAADGRILKLTGFWDPQAAFAELGLA
jgi:ketosteroid isomerase-like protein